jgi:phage repressor protein C with HTH and peptisase S24 domain
MASRDIIERVEKILRETRQPNGGEWSARSLAIASGLTPTHIGRILNYNKTGRVSTPTLKKIAAAARVRPEWLLTGEEPMRPDKEQQDQYPNRARAVAAARALGTVSEEAIATVRSTRLKSATADLTPNQWLDKILTAERDEQLGIVTDVDTLPIDKA